MIGVLFSWLLLGRGVGGSLTGVRTDSIPRQSESLVLSLDVNQLCAFFS
jgi:hypothetical protein